MGNPRMLTAMTAGAALVIGAVLALATNSWWLLPAALLVHAIASTVVFRFIAGRIAQGDKPDPVTEAHLDDGEKPAAGATPHPREDREIVI
jgi:membrane protein implicated in regulation of membrane protease activity